MAIARRFEKMGRRVMDGGDNEHSLSFEGGRGRLVIFSGQVYELTLRVRSGLPFVPCDTVNALIKSAMAQAQSITGVTICHYLWMGNHAHMLVIVNDPENLVKFYGIVKKSLTDHMKRLLGLRSLVMWEGRKVQLIADYQTMAARIAYFYANPAKASLVDNIDEYPGMSSYQAFKHSGGEDEYEYREKIRWIRPKYLKKLDNPCLTVEEDRSIAAELEKRAYYEHNLIIRPNAWLKVLKVPTTKVLSMMQRVLGGVKRAERVAREKRALDGRSCLGREGLIRQEIMKPFEPKKYGACMFVMCADRARRMEIIQMVVSVRRECTRLYHERFKKGKRVTWPPGTFPPRGPMVSFAQLP